MINVANIPMSLGLWKIVMIGVFGIALWSFTEVLTTPPYWAAVILDKVLDKMKSNHRE